MDIKYPASKADCPLVCYTDGKSCTADRTNSADHSPLRVPTAYCGRLRANDVCFPQIQLCHLNGNTTDCRILAVCVVTQYLP